MQKYESRNIYYYLIEDQKGFEPNKHTSIMYFSIDKKDVCKYQVWESIICMDYDRLTIKVIIYLIAGMNHDGSHFLIHTQSDIINRNSITGDRGLGTSLLYV